MVHSRWKCLVVFSAVPCGTAMAQQAVERVDREEVVKRIAEDVERLKAQGEGLNETEAAGARAPRERGIELGAGIYGYGYLSAAYVYNLNGPPARRGANFYRLNDGDHDTFALPFVQLGLARDVSGKNELDVGFKAEVGIGRLVERGFQEDGLFDSAGSIDLVQAYAAAQVGTPWGLPVTARVGRMGLTWGNETLDLRRNASFSLGLLHTFGPRTLTGVALDVDLGDGLSYTQYLANGWDRVTDDNDGKTVAGELVYAVEGLRMRGHWILGAEREGHEGDKRWAVGFDASWSPRLGTDLMFAGVYGEEEGADRRDGGRARFGGVSLTAKQGFLYCEADRFHRLGFAVRGELFRDQGGSRSTEDQTIGSLTATIEVRPLEPLALRLEYRRDMSSEDVFTGSQRVRARDAQDTFAAELSFSF